MKAVNLLKIIILKFGKNEKKKYQNEKLDVFSLIKNQINFSFNYFNYIFKIFIKISSVIN